MKTLYFVRHGNADYMKDGLTQRGIAQVERFSSKLEGLLPNNQNLVLVTSPSGRAIETAQILIPMLERKTGGKVYFERENALYQTRSMGSDKIILENGRQNLFLLDKYSKYETGVFTAHDKIIVGTCIAIGEFLEIKTPTFLRAEQPIDESLVSWAIKEFGYTREKAEEQVRKYAPSPLIEFPEMPEASAICIDIEQKQINRILI